VTLLTLWGIVEGEMYLFCLAFQKLFDGVKDSATGDTYSAILSQIISVGVVHGEPVCRIAAAVNEFCWFQHRILSR